MRRFLWGAAGFAWGVGHGFLTLLVTGGGHGNFLWVSVFLMGYMFGLLVPAAAFVVADTGPFWAKVSGWCSVALIFALTLLSLFILSPGAIEDAYLSWSRSPSLFVFMSALHFVPVTFFAIRLATFDSNGDTGHELTQLENI
ncbi:MAG: hypothetical protein IPM21_05620 [Acidobacteria bacterium]|nr:hypothetical protein [Acidobacteriota bacterium]